MMYFYIKYNEEKYYACKRKKGIIYGTVIYFCIRNTEKPLML